jgi:hypothetical protein
MKFMLWLPLLLVVSTSAGGSAPLRLQVSPRNSFAPSYLQVLVRVEPDEANRSLTIAADSEGYYRSSEIPLEGERGPRSVLLSFREVPEGEYHVSAAVFDSRGSQRARAQQQVVVLSSGSVR